MITVLMKQFTGEFDIQQVAETRASLAIWGDSEVIKAASRWNRTIAEIRDDVKKQKVVTEFMLNVVTMKIKNFILMIFNGEK